MAQTKTKASSKRSTGSKKPQARSRGSSSKSRSSSSSKSRRSPKSTSSRKPAPVAAVGNAAEKATDKVGNATSAVGNATGKATSAVGHAAKKARVPLVAGGAALAGTAGGIVLGARQARRHRHRGRTLAKAARGAGTLGAQVGHLAYELQRNREAINGNGSSKQHRSPVEVVLEGLTARRSRS